MVLTLSHITFRDWSCSSTVLPQGTTMTIGTPADSCIVDTMPCSLFSVER